VGLYREGLRRLCVVFSISLIFPFLSCSFLPPFSFLPFLSFPPSVLSSVEQRVGGISRIMKTILLMVKISARYPACSTRHALIMHVFDVELSQSAPNNYIQLDGKWLGK
jgi:hypothetical protein